MRYLKNGDGGLAFGDASGTQDLTRFMPDLAYTDFDWRQKDFEMELAEGFDRGENELY